MHSLRASSDDTLKRLYAAARKLKRFKIPTLNKNEGEKYIAKFSYFAKQEAIHAFLLEVENSPLNNLNVAQASACQILLKRYSDRLRRTGKPYDSSTPPPARSLDLPPPPNYTVDLLDTASIDTRYEMKDDITRHMIKCLRRDGVKPARAALISPHPRNFVDFVNTRVKTIRDPKSHLWSKILTYFEVYAKKYKVPL